MDLVVKMSKLKGDSVSRSSDTAGKMCRKCKALSFDDRAVGGFQCDMNGAKVLCFNDPRPEQSSRLEIWSLLDYTHDDYLPDLPGLATSAGNGCDFCAFLRTAIRQQVCERSEWHGCKVTISLLYLWHLVRGSVPQRDPMAKHDFVEKQPLQYSLAALIAHLEVLLPHDGDDDNDDDDDDDDRWADFKIFFIAEATPSDCAGWLNLERPPFDDVLCSQNIAMIQEEIEFCAENCPTAPVVEDFVPTRLLDLTDSQNPRLIVPDQNVRNDRGGSNIKYAALSYCWGPACDAVTMLKTEQISLESRRNGIAISEMPVVFQEAILVCQRLSIRYLWIDALCIIQDNKTDWEQEASRMGRLYESSVLTIVPLASHAHNERFLHRPQQTFLVPFHSTIQPGIQGEIYLRHIPRIAIGKGFYYGDLYCLEEFNSRWGKRGWTFQEETLSTRSLYFGQSRLFYRCRHWSRSEVDDQRSFDPKASAQLCLYQGDWLNKLYLWEEFVSEFSSRHFTFPTDKLPAISGIAQSLPGLNRDEYVVGLWRGELLRGLLWHADPASEWQDFVLEGSNKYVAPSWSWACRNSRICYGVRNHQLPRAREAMTPECRLVDIRVELASSEPFGAVRSAVINVSGKLAALPSTLKLMPSDFIHPTWKITLGDVLLGGCDFDWITNAKEDWKAPCEGLMMLLVASWRRKVKKSLGQTRTRMGSCALILRPSGENNQYRRVGICYFANGPGFSRDAPWNNRLFRGKKAQNIQLV